MLKISALIAISFLFGCRASQNHPAITQEGGKIPAAVGMDSMEVARIEASLSHDSMEGRAIYTPAIDKAAAFISTEMKQADLQPLPGSLSFLHEIETVKGEITSSEVNIENDTIAAEHIFCKASNPVIAFTDADNYKIVRINPGDNLRKTVRSVLNSNENTLVLIDLSLSWQLKSIAALNEPILPQETNQVFILTHQTNATHFNVTITQKQTVQKLANVIGYLPGSKNPNEYIIFSAHYDHIGIGKPDASGDSIYNGANDDASGVTAVLTLAKYYSELKNNKRSIIFAAFTAEESGGHGSKYFSNHIDPGKIIAMLNIEMIGTESKWGLNSAYITGFEKSDFGKMLQENVAGTKYSFQPDPYPDQNLFYRSDNASLAIKGVPAHTISTSKMNNEGHYHKPGDEIGTLDLKNLTEIINAIAIGASTLISGKDSPSRIINIP